MAGARRPLSESASSGTSPDAHTGLRIVVVAEHTLVAEAVRVALSGRGHDAVVMHNRAHTAPRCRSGPPEVGILLTNGSAHYSTTAGTLLERLTIPWLVLASEEWGPGWGAHYASGAALVVPPSTGLDDVCQVLRGLAAGRRPPGPRGRRELIRAWRQMLLERDELNGRLSSLTTREQQVLQRLHEGVGVRSIAQGSEVAEATVRTQVKAILRKLDVSSQIAAVAAYTQVQGDGIARQ